MTAPFQFIATGQSLIHYDLRSINDARFEAIKSIIREADASFTNFEMTVYGRHAGWPLKGLYFSCADPDVLDSLRDIGFSILSLSNNHAFDLGPSGVRVNSIAPGEIDTAILSPGTDKIVETIPLRRLGAPAEVAKAIYYLCTDQSSYVTGAEIAINGGQHV